MASSSDTTLQSDEVLERAAELFRLMSAPLRLKIIGALCEGEKNVSELLAHVATTQPNMSQHLNALYRAGVLGRRRCGVQIYYRIANPHVTPLCRAVCALVAGGPLAADGPALADLAGNPPVPPGGPRSYDPSGYIKEQ